MKKQEVGLILLIFVIAYFGIVFFNLFPDVLSKAFSFQSYNFTVLQILTTIALGITLYFYYKGGQR
jgi:hypothetical protein